MPAKQKGISKAEYAIILALAVLILAVLIFLPSPRHYPPTGGVVTDVNAPNNVNEPSNNALRNEPIEPKPEESEEREKCGTEFTRKWDSKKNRYISYNYDDCDNPCDVCDYSFGDGNYWGYCEARAYCYGECCEEGECCHYSEIEVAESIITCDTYTPSDTPTAAVVGTKSGDVLPVGEGGTCDGRIWWAPPPEYSPGGPFQFVTLTYHIYIRTEEEKQMGIDPHPVIQDGQALTTNNIWATIKGLTVGCTYYVTVVAELNGGCRLSSNESDPWVAKCSDAPIDPTKPPTAVESQFLSTSSREIWDPDIGQITETVTRLEAVVDKLGTYYLYFTETLCPAQWTVIDKKEVTQSTSNVIIFEVVTGQTTADWMWEYDHAFFKISYLPPRY